MTLSNSLNFCSASLSFMQLFSPSDCAFRLACRCARSYVALLLMSSSPLKSPIGGCADPFATTYTRPAQPKPAEGSILRTPLPRDLLSGRQFFSCRELDRWRESHADGQYRGNRYLL